MAEAEKAKVLRLAGVKVLEEMEEEADELRPAHPERIDDLEDWLVRARELAGRLPFRETLAQMRARARPWSDDERARDRETHPQAAELKQKTDELEQLVVQLEQGPPGPSQEAAVDRLAELEPEVLALRDSVEARRTWSFCSAEIEWQHQVLTELVGALEP